MTESKQYDVIMVGSGPSSLAAAVYTTREELSTLLIEKGAIGGLAATTDIVENYPGFVEPVSGLELADKFQKHAERFGAKIELGEVRTLEQKGEGIEVTTEATTFQAKTVLIATGSSYRKLGIPGEEEFYGRGVHYCATCDGALYKDKHLVVVGGGNSAAQEALFLTKFASQIDILVRSDKMRATEILQERLRNNPKIKIHFNVPTKEIVGQDNKVEAVVAVNKDTSDEVRFETDGVFVFIGLVPNTGFLKDSGIELDDVGFIKTDDNLMTNIEGIFASGDVRSGALMQIATSTGEGVTAAIRIREYLQEKDH